MGLMVAFGLQGLDTVRGPLMAATGSTHSWHREIGCEAPASKGKQMIVVWATLKVCSYACKEGELEMKLSKGSGFPINLYGAQKS